MGPRQLGSRLSRPRLRNASTACSRAPRTCCRTRCWFSGNPRALLPSFCPGIPLLSSQSVCCVQIRRLCCVSNLLLPSRTALARICCCELRPASISRLRTQRPSRCVPPLGLCEAARPSRIYFESQNVTIWSAPQTHTAPRRTPLSIVAHPAQHPGHSSGPREAEFRNAESQFSQILYQQGKCTVQKLTESNSAFQSEIDSLVIFGSKIEKAFRVDPLLKKSTRTRSFPHSPESRTSRWARPRPARRRPSSPSGVRT